MLKADFHIHTKEDLEDTIKYSAKDLIDHCSKLGFDVLAITNHNDLFFNKEIDDYAKSKGILLIPGVERKIEGKHVIILNESKEKVMQLEKVRDLKKIKSKTNLIIAPHPFFIWPTSLFKSLTQNLDLFDALEFYPIYSFFYNSNKETLKVAKKYNLPLVASSDAHHLFQIGRNYTLIDSVKDKEKIIEAIKDGRVKYDSKPLNLYLLLKTLGFMFFSSIWIIFGKSRP